MTLLLSIVLASLAGSLHCVGMCGGLSAVASSGDCSRKAVQQGVGYHLARLAGYACLGALAGGVGAGLETAGELLGVQHAAALFSGVVLMVWGLRLLLSGTSLGPNASGLTPLGKRARKLSPAQRLGALAGQLSRRALRLPPLLRATLLGVGSALLPCGWLWAFVLGAAATGSAVQGALAMLAFWVGTLPALLGWNWLVRWATQKVGPRLPRVVGAVLLCFGCWNVAQRWPHAAHAASDEVPSQAGASCH